MLFFQTKVHAFERNSDFHWIRMHSVGKCQEKVEKLKKLKICPKFGGRFLIKTWARMEPKSNFLIRILYWCQNKINILSDWSPFETIGFLVQYLTVCEVSKVFLHYEISLRSYIWHGHVFVRKRLQNISYRRHWILVNIIN